MHAIVLAALVGPVFCCGFQYESGSWGGGCGTISRDTNTGRVDYGITHLTLNGRVYAVLVSEAGSSSCSGGPPASGTLRATDGRKVEWTCVTPNGKVGRVTVGSEQFDLENGAVFLVDLRGGRTSVQQLHIDMTRLQGGFLEEKIKQVARGNSRLAAFLKVCETPK